MSAVSRPSELREALTSRRSSLVVVGIVSACVNVLMLASPIYMMMVYDSVLPSQSLPTLVGLLAMVSVAFCFQALFDLLRGRMIGVIAAGFDHHLSDRVQQAAFAARLRHPDQPDLPGSAVRDLDNIRNFLASGGPGALMDMPWIPFFVIILAMLHVWLAAATIVGAAVMAVFAWASHSASRNPTRRISRSTGRRASLASETWRHAELVKALGMENRLRARWAEVNRQFLRAQKDLGDAGARIGASSRAFRIFLQSFILTVGALLVIEGKASGGVIFASAIISGRALAPIDSIIGHWKGFEIARESWRRLDRMFEAIPPRGEPVVALPAAKRSVSVDDVVVPVPGTAHICVRSATFELAAGDALGVIGASGSGKSSLIRALVGAWPVARGAVRLDDAALDQYDSEAVGRSIGYLPQDVELLTGTIAANISRFEPDPNSERIVAAAREAGVHSLIVTMPDGYATEVGPEGSALSGGQQQRIALARALYGDPFLVVLDEPNSNLDGEGEAALDQAIQNVRDRGGIVVIVAHRAVALQRVNKLLYMENGAMGLFGPRDAVLDRLQGRPAEVAGPGQAEPALEQAEADVNNG